MDNIVPMSTVYNEIVDCRLLHLELEFCKFTLPELIRLAEKVFLEIQSLSSDTFYVCWYLGKRSVSPDTLRNKIQQSNGAIDFMFEGDAIGGVVHNKKTFMQYDQRIFTDLTFSSKCSTPSIDYPEVFRQYFSNVNSPEQYKNAVLGVFNEKHRKKLARWYGHDLSGKLFSSYHRKQPDLYYGNFKMEIPAVCLSSNLDVFAGRSAKFLQDLAEEFPCVSGRIALTPIRPPAFCSGHMRYFSGRTAAMKQCCSGGHYTEWDAYHYIRGVEWYNLISHTQAQYVPNILTEAELYPDIVVDGLKNGSVVVQSKKHISQLDIDDLVNIKKLLYAVLYPGTIKIELTNLRHPDRWMYLTKPRCDWECVPIFENEVSIIDDCIVFSHG